MSNIQVKSKYDCRWDAVSLGEVMLRFDAGDERIQTTRSFTVREAGGEYNVARSLSKVFRQRTAIFTALAKNPLGRLAEDLILQSGVDASQILWRDADTGGSARNGLYFSERGFGYRAPNSYFDRDNTAISQLQTSEIDWNWIFGEYNARWFHTGGMFTGLSQSTPKVAAVAMQFARKHGAIVSYDLNYREALWRTRGGLDAANSANRNFLPFADVIFGVPGFKATLSNFNEQKFAETARNLQIEFPNIKAIFTTLRDEKSASRHDFTAVCFSNFQVTKARVYPDAEVYDRTGSGDAFAAGVIYSLLTGKEIDFAVNCGAAHAVLAMTTPGGGSMTSLAEIESLVSQETATAVR